MLYISIRRLSITTWYRLQWGWPRAPASCFLFCSPLSPELSSVVLEHFNHRSYSILRRPCVDRNGYSDSWGPLATQSTPPPQRFPIQKQRQCLRQNVRWPALRNKEISLWKLLPEQLIYSLLSDKRFERANYVYGKSKNQQRYLSRGQRAWGRMLERREREISRGLSWWEDITISTHSNKGKLQFTVLPCGSISLAIIILKWHFYWIIYFNYY